MQTKMENMQKYIGYTKCGEILKPPSGGYHRPYVLKCFHCKEIYLLFEAFIYHIEDDCKSLIADGPNKDYVDETVEGYSITEPLELGDKNVKVDTEKNCMPMKVDPLIFVNPEHLPHYDVTYAVKGEEFKPSDNLNNTLNIVYEEKLPTAEELRQTKSNESLDNWYEDDYHSSDDEEDIENSSVDIINDEENEDDFEIELSKKEKKDAFNSVRLSNFANEFLKTKEHVITSVIEAYKKQPNLWNKNFPHAYKGKRQTYLEDIADELNKQHNLSLTWKQVGSVIGLLCRTYREDLKAIKVSHEFEQDYTPSWYFQDLNFLKPFMENNQIAKLDSHMPDLLPEQVKEIIKIYRGLPHIWNTDMIEHFCKNKVDAAKKEMLDTIEKKLGIKINKNILEKYFRAIKNCFTRAKRKHIDNKKPDNTNSEDNNLLEDYYEDMLFLKDHVGSFRCSECDRIFKSPVYLKIHQTNAHGLEPVQCSQCKKPFKSITTYRNHVRHHMEDLNHECKECNKKFLHSNELRIHMRNHTGFKPFCCDICGASFRYVQGFGNHYRRHIKKYLHTCDICGKGFYAKDRFNDHMNSHSNIRNEVCKVCGKTFITKRSLQQHVVIHDDVRKYSCKLCGKTFKQKTGVNQHMRTHGPANNSEEKSATKKEQN